MTERLGAAELDDLAVLGTATIGEVAGQVARILDSGIAALSRAGPAAAGHAFTVACRPGDNLAIHRALTRVAAGDILVVDCGGNLGSGPFGEIMALAARVAGVRGLVIDGAVRDTAAILEMGFPVFCRGVAIPGTTKDDPGRIGLGCTAGGTEIRQGDVIVADADAVIAIGTRRARDVIAKGRARLDREKDIMNRIRSGETTSEIFGLQ